MLVLAMCPYTNRWLLVYVKTNNRATLCQKVISDHNLRNYANFIIIIFSCQMLNTFIN